MSLKTALCHRIVALQCTSLSLKVAVADVGNLPITELGTIMIIAPINIQAFSTLLGSTACQHRHGFGNRHSMIGESRHVALPYTPVNCELQLICPVLKRPAHS